MQQQYIDLYHNHHQTIKKHSSEVLNSVRDEAFTTFKTLGFPSSSHEGYAYTNLIPALSIDYGLNFSRLSFPVDPHKVFTCNVPDIHAYLYFVVNDSLYAVKNKLNETLPAGVIVGNISQIALTHPDLLEQYVGRLVANKKDGLTAFNGTFAQDGFFIYVPKNVVLHHPIQIVNIMRADVDCMILSHNIVVIEEGAKAQVLICDHTVDNVHFLCNRITEVFVSKNATFEQYALENTHTKTTNLSSTYMLQEKNSNVLINMITLHNGLTRNTIEIDIAGEHCETLLCGMVVGDKKQQVDNFTTISHNKPHCNSRELFKYILNDTAKGIFTGKIYVAKDAQKTKAFQTNRNILVSKTAFMRTKPQLEIYADDIQCSHGATIGSLDEKMQFYLQSRGISKKEARLLLLFAFINDVIDNIRIPALQDRIRLLVEGRLRGDLSHCQGCAICE